MIYIGIPSYDRRLDIDMAFNLARIRNHDLMFQSISSSLITYSRNYLATQFLKTQCEYLLFLDSDIIIQDPTFIDKLLETSKIADIVGGAYMIKGATNEYVAANVVDEIHGVLKMYQRKKAGELKEPELVDAVGTGIMLIKRKVFETLEDPWFEMIDFSGAQVFPEDFNFCLKAQKAGFKVAIDPCFATMHMGIGFWKHNVLE